ncbi:MAG: DUF1015 domain-containing protein [Candidatus Omnitrophica bacterium]|nr:DUF1015 domain-containing protein [Candidatus Omnitrophota bacterium]
MTNAKAFKGVYYNLDKIVDLSQVVCPPYDVVSREEQDFYYRKSPYNFIRLILNKEESDDNNFNNRYTRSDIFFNDWLKTGILKQDSEEALYFYKQDYFCDNKEFSRLGFIGLLQISESGIVFPHENTHVAPKTDRLELLKSVKANLSPIFTIFSDKDKIIEVIFNDCFSKRKPDFLLKDTQGVRNSVWRLTDTKKIQEISAKMSNKQIFIADGHHRYEVALMYLRLMQEQDKNYSLDKSYNYIMTYFTAVESDGLCIMPVHRIIKSEINVDSLKGIFKISRLNSIADLEDRLRLSSKKECVFGLYHRNDVLSLELKNKKEVDDYFKNKECFINLDVAILDFYVLNELLKIKKDAIIYTKEIDEAKELVDSNEGFSAFALRPTSIKQIRDVALCGEKMPPKSTYFYPKLLSGLTVYKFSEDIPT